MADFLEGRAVAWQDIAFDGGQQLAVGKGLERATVRLELALDSGQTRGGELASTLSAAFDADAVQR